MLYLALLQEHPVFTRLFSISICPFILLFEVTLNDLGFFNNGGGNIQLSCLQRAVR